MTQRKALVALRFCLCALYAALIICIALFYSIGAALLAILCGITAMFETEVHRDIKQMDSREQDLIRSIDDFTRERQP